MRSVFVQRKVLELYQDMDSVSYPIQPELLLQCIPKSCRILSYQEMAEVTGCTVQDVAVPHDEAPRLRNPCSARGCGLFQHKEGRFYPRFTPID